MDVHQAATHKEAAMENYLFDDPLAELDPDLVTLIEFEEARQTDKIQLIASESICPRPVIAALATPFMNKYAEGYPSNRMVRKERAMLPDFARHLAFFRRYSDRRYYKGTEYCDFVEALAQKRCAELFANPNAPLKSVVVNVQPLSGAPANNAVYDALLRPYDTVMGLHLSHGGHLTHGSPVNRSGKNYKIVAYTVNPETWRLDYDQIHKQALEAKPKMIIAGASAYPLDIDWARFRAIADEVGAYLLADISHPAGLVSAGLYPNPVGLAHVTMFTTHKSMCGPRGAVLITTNSDIAKKIDFAVFPGEQGGPHVNQIAAKAVAFKIAQTDRFKRLQKRIVENALAFVESFKKYGMPVGYGTTNSHLMLVDLREYKNKVSAEIAANILDLCGITCNKNTLPGDTNALRPSGLRFGTVTISQRGMGTKEVDRIAELISRVVSKIEPYRVRGSMGRLARGKVDFGLMREIREEVKKLTGAFPPFRRPQTEGIPPIQVKGKDAPTTIHAMNESAVLEIKGERALSFLQQASTGDIANLKTGGAHRVAFLDPQGKTIDKATILNHGRDANGRWTYTAVCDGSGAGEWLHAISDGYVSVGPDKFSKIHGPVGIRTLRKIKRDRTAVVPVAITGPKAVDVLRRAAKDKIEIGSFGTASITGSDCTAIVLDGAVQVLIKAEDASKVFKALVTAGNEYSVGEGAQPKLPEPTVDSAKPFYIGQKKDSTAANRPAFEWKPPEDTGKKTPLFPMHKARGARILPFGGYQMPGWYGSVAEEHAAVRSAAGIFDVGHMGVFEVSGDAAAEFIDTVTTNFVPRLDPGHSHYTYVLDVDGHVMDDIIVYRLAWDRFMLVVNASNQDKLWAWFNAVNDRKVIIDRDHPSRVAPGPVHIRNLKAMSSGDDMRMDIAFQGRAAMPVIKALISDAGERERVQALHRFNLTPAHIGELDVIVSRTGYTGEEIGYELFVHPKHAVKLVETLLKAGEGTGVKMAGLAARDSTRTEAGFPLYGHELAGKYDIIPSEAGYAAFVKRHKPFFVGRKAIIEREDASDFTVIRFKMTDTDIRAIRGEDRVVNKNGEVVGYVTSACVVDKVQIGLAYINKEYADEKTELGIVMLPRKEGAAAEKAKADLKIGDKITPHYRAVVLPRFQFFGAKA
jgi:glycine hydroxymethyltransferase